LAFKLYPEVGAIEVSVLSSRARTSPAINRNRNNYYSTDNDLLNVVGPTDLLATIAQKSHDQCTYQ
jgi:hypothetical protein